MQELLVSEYGELDQEHREATTEYLEAEREWISKNHDPELKAKRERALARLEAVREVVLRHERTDS
jgi:hypothetical protein